MILTRTSLVLSSLIIMLFSDVVMVDSKGEESGVASEEPW